MQRKRDDVGKNDRWIKEEGIEMMEQRRRKDWGEGKRNQLRKEGSEGEEKWRNEQREM